MHWELLCIFEYVMHWQLHVWSICYLVLMAPNWFYNSNSSHDNALLLPVHAVSVRDVGAAEGSC